MIRSLLCGGALALVSLVLAAPALAVPALFSGGVSISTPRRAPGTLSVVVPQITPTGMLTVTGGSPASFTIPTGTFYTASAASLYFTFGLAYPLISVAPPGIVRGNTGMGVFFPFYFSPGVPVMISADPTMSPNLAGSPRAGYMLLVPGPNGFGGAMKMATFGKYTGYWAPAGGHTFYQTLMALRGSAFLPTVPGAVLGMRVPGVGATPGVMSYTSVGVVTEIGWITGRAVAYEPAGAFATKVTLTGMDSRTPGGSGMISMVSPRLLHIFFGIGAPLGKSEAFASMAKLGLVIGFVPEPGRLALLATGLLGLFALRR